MSGPRVSIRPGVSVLSVLRHLNYKPWFAIAEFVDNAIQSAATHAGALRAVHGPDWRLTVSIDILSDGGGSILIRDNAGGIGAQDFPRAFRPAVVPPDRSGLSEFGMGMKSAACWFAPNWSVRTKALGELVGRRVAFDVAQIVRDELQDLEVEETPAASNEHYTEIRLDKVHSIPTRKTLAKIKDHLRDIYRMFTRQSLVEIRLNGELLEFEELNVLVAPHYRDPKGAPLSWRKEIDFDFGQGLRVQGFAALMDPGNYNRSGFALFRRNRLIQGAGEESYRPAIIFGRSSRNSYASLRLFGELNLEGFEVTHTKDGFTWDGNEEPFLDLLKSHLDSDELPLLRQAANYRVLSARKDRTAAATTALGSTASALEAHIVDVLPTITEEPPVETQSTPLAERPLLALRELKFEFRGSEWLVRIELSDDPTETEWLAVSEPGTTTSGCERIDIRVAMAHPFMVSFAQHDAEDIDPLLRVAAALALAEKLATRAGVKASGTVRRNVNQILREALSQP